MAFLKKPLKRIARHVKNPIRRAKLELKQGLGWLDQPIILPYRSFGNGQEFRMLGRVMEDSGLSKTARHNSKAQNMLAMGKRFLSDDIPEVKVRARFGDQEQIVMTDTNGYFEVCFDTDGQADHGAWNDVHFELLESVVEGQASITATGEVLLPPADTQFGVISDVDDTILISHATQTLKKFKLMLLKNARTRAPFEGVAAFYRALQQGGAGCPPCGNPIFYVSSSEWNLYDLLTEFCRNRGIPKGPFLLREMEAEWYKVWKSGGGSHNHKHDKIKRILETYPHLQFILIGDSGQHDAEIYAKTVHNYPGRILAVYIRDVSKNRREREVVRLADQLRPMEVDMLLVKDSVEAARHAAEQGFIQPEAIQAVEEDRVADERAPTELEEVVGETASV
ncbi:Phosphatidate phosphatase APP1 [Catalinimonas alkaloidigena]|uniref:Phosphatidate phosphatase APP1 n=1 Tax=Catalinimonas alkaloidigena TaxID=1075417 RepID=A0A1G9BLN5_9BACT|nr:phosphatase domain-containing protein [Catalinimonas alkaloidigena]SDK39765.1 Phosphatidate phosphatase APP1 [Catalinimonas alkaloidigena]